MVKSDAVLWDKLRASLQGVGFDEGDFLPLITLSPQETNNYSFTNTTYQDASGYQEWYILENVSEHIPKIDSIWVTMRINAGTDETVDYRVRLPYPDVTLIERTGFTGKTIPTSDFETFPERDNFTYLQMEVRTNPGVNSSEVQKGIIVLGRTI